MAKKNVATTGYTSPVRDEAKQATRERILDALVRVVLEDGIHAFSVATVAQRAGVSHRTVYRHFASREDLLEALAESVDAASLTEATGTPGRPPDPSLDAASEQAGGMIRALERLRDQASAEFIMSVALRHNTRGKRQRWAFMQAKVRERFPALRPREQLAGAAVVRGLASSNLWFHLCVQLGVPADAAVEGISRALDLVVEDLARRNDARSREKRSRGSR